MTLAISRLGFAGLVYPRSPSGCSSPTADRRDHSGSSADADHRRAGRRGVLGAGSARLRLCSTCRHAWPGRASCAASRAIRRALCCHFGIDIIAGTLIGALAAGFLAARPRPALSRTRRRLSPFPAWSPWCRAPTPSARSSVACRLPRESPPATVSETLSLSATVGLMVGAIAVGVAAPALLISCAIVSTIAARRRFPLRSRRETAEQPSVHGASLSAVGCSWRDRSVHRRDRSSPHAAPTGRSL